MLSMPNNKSMSKFVILKTFKFESLNGFRIKGDEYPSVAEKAILTLPTFCNNLPLRGVVFSAYFHTKIVYRNRLRMPLSDIQQNFKTLVSQTTKQFHSWRLKY